MVKQTVRWWKNGDHPKDNSVAMTPEAIGQAVSEGIYMRSFLTEGEVVRFFNHPDESDAGIDAICGQPWLAHGWIDQGEEGRIVHPGDYVDVNAGKTGYQVEHPDPMAEALAKVEAERAQMEVPPEAQGIPVTPPQGVVMPETDDAEVEAEAQTADGTDQ